MAYSPRQQQSVMYSPSQQQLVVSSPNQQQRTYSPSRQEDKKGALGEEEKERMIAQVSEYSMAGIFLPSQPCSQPPVSGHVTADRALVYIVPCR